MGTIKKQYPDLTEKQMIVATEVLRQYFSFCCISGENHVAIPSIILSKIWKELSRHTKLYNRFCDKAFGKHLRPSHAKAGINRPIQRAWQYSCEAEGIDLENPKKIPLLFRIDDELSIHDGHIFKIDGNRDENEYCVKDIGRVEEAPSHSISDRADYIDYGTGDW